MQLLLFFCQLFRDIIKIKHEMSYYNTRNIFHTENVYRISSDMCKCKRFYQTERA